MSEVDGCGKPRVSEVEDELMIQMVEKGQEKKRKEKKSTVKK